MNKPLIAVVLASYNSEKYISQQLDSILSQSWPCNIHIFDDASTDGSVQLIQKKYLKYKNITLTTNKKNLGYVRNFEQGIKMVHELGANYIALSDQDDIWKADKLQKMMATLLTSELNEPKLAYSDLRMINSDSTVIHQSYFKYRGYASRLSGSTHSLPIALGQNGVMGNTILMNRQLVELALPFPNHLHSHDYWISLIAQLHGKCFFIKEALVDYRIHETNTSNSINTLNSAARTKKNTFWQKIQNRDFQLPYKEDRREITLMALYYGDERQNSAGTVYSISLSDRKVIDVFLSYLRFDKPRWLITYWMLKNKFIKKGWKYKVRFSLKCMTTRRY